MPQSTTDAVDADELQESQARIRGIFDASADGIITIDERGQIESLNAAMERLFGYTIAELIGQNVNILMPSPFREEHGTYLRNYLATGQKKVIGIGREVLGRRKDGSLFPITLAVSEVQLVNRRVFTGIVHDATNRQQLEASLAAQARATRDAQEEIIYRLVRASLYHDEETGAHMERTGMYSELMAATAGWTSEAAAQIRLAAPMHDLGKIGIPDSILRKPAGLTPEETAVMQLHTVVGAKMLLGSTSPVLQLASDIAVAHHEWWDGNGYPFGLSGPDIPESARIVAIVDVYDALTHDRVYRPALPETKVVQMIADRSGTQFEPRLVNIFMSVLPEMRAIALTVHDNSSEMVDLSTIECSNNCLTQASTAGK